MTHHVPNATARNGVDVPNLFGTIDPIRDQPELAQFRFRATNRWVVGTHSRTTIETFSGAGGDHRHTKDFAYDADHPAVLVGADQGPTPVEFLLARARRVPDGRRREHRGGARRRRSPRSKRRIEGDIDLQGLLGLSDEVRNGYQQIRVTFGSTATRRPRQLREIVEQSRARSAVYDVLSNGVDVTVDVAT